jgi:NAD(P)-dependent dehydrogenase (short-subunit alcohol dehydrogenase family)
MTEHRGRVAGKIALVTGAAAGIGRTVADRFVREGARVVYTDRDVDAAQAAAEAAGGSAIALAMDVSDEASVSAAFDAAAARGWTPDVVVANAGVQLFGEDAEVADLDVAVWRRTIDINLTGAFLTLKHAVRGMLAIGGGSIILTGSPTAVRGEGADFTAYSTSKAGVHGLGRTVAAAYAKRGIRVNTVGPAYTETGLVRTITDDPDARAAIIGRIPMGRAGTPADLEGVYVFLASDDSAFATGGVFAVDGGMTTL